MSVRTILKWPDKNLRKLSSDLDILDGSNFSLAEDLHDTMVVNFGLGIAASQVGINKNMFIVDSKELPDFPQDPEINDGVVFINPKITVLDSNQLTSVESCLSVDGITAQVKRNAEIEIEYFDLGGQKKLIKTSGRQSCILQHEFDHLIGKLFLDRLNNYTKNKIIKKINKQQREIKKATIDLESKKEKDIVKKRAKIRAARKRKNKIKKKRK